MEPSPPAMDKSVVDRVKSAVEGRQIFVLLDHGRGRNLQLDPDGKPTADLDNSPYGYLHAAELGADVRFSRTAAEHRFVRLGRRALKFVIGFDLVQAWRNRERLREADIVWTHTEHEHLAVSVLHRLGLLPQRPMISQSIWLWDDWSTRWWCTRVILRWLLATGSQGHTTHSPVNAALGTSVMGDSVMLLPYGVGLEVPHIRPAGKSRAPVIVSLGNDRHRDWAKLRAVAKEFPTWTFRVFSGRSAARSADQPSNYAVARLPDSGGPWSVLSDSDAVALTLKENGHASGLSVVFESLLGGRVVIATRTGGLDAYFPIGVDFVEPHSTARDIGLRIGHAVERGVMVDGGRIIRERGLTDRDFAMRHILLSAELLTSSSVSPSTRARVAAFRPPFP